MKALAELRIRFTAKGFKVRMVSIEHLAELEREIEALRAQALISASAYDYVNLEYDFRMRDAFPEARSLIIAAASTLPVVRVVFHAHGQRISALIPPILGSRDRIDREAEEITAHTLRQGGYTCWPARLPKKLLAVHSGLGQYGKNTLCYIPGMGSFHRLVSFCSDLPCQHDDWQAISQLESCRECSACLRRCPTQAITAEQFPIHIERCLGYLNEGPGDFPEWVDRSWHHCVVGCLRCEAACPQNRGLLKPVQKAEFSEEETALLLDDEALDRLPAGLALTLKQLGLARYQHVLSRNLRALADKAQQPHKHTRLHSTQTDHSRRPKPCHQRQSDNR